MIRLINKKAYSLIELTIVLTVMTLMVVAFSMFEELVKEGRLVNAINLTAQQPQIVDNNQLMLWLESSMISKERAEGEELIDWGDLGKNKIIFQQGNEYSKTTFEDRKIAPGIKSISFNGYSKMESEKALNINSYTAFVVAKAERQDGNGYIYNFGPILKEGHFRDALIVTIINDGNGNKSTRNELHGTFVAESNQDEVLNSRPSKMILGDKNFEGEIFEIILFDGLLDEETMFDIEKYLHQKYNN